MKDLYTNEPLCGFTKKELPYITFQNRRNMLAYFKKFPDKIEEISRILFKNRKELKDLKYAPTTVELRSTVLPTVSFLKKHGIDYNKLCEELGFVEKANYNINLIFDEPEEKHKIWIDTREQYPLNFREECDITETKLAFGDYCCVSKFNNVYYERKSLMDFVSTISQGFDRFRDEIKRAKESGSYIVVMVETILNHALTFNYLKYMRWTKARPEFIFNRIRQICQEFDNIQFVFVDGRIEMKRLMLKLFDYDGDIKNVDLEYYYSEKLI